MEPAPEFNGKIHVEWSGGEFGNEEKWISVGPMHDSGWEEDLAKDIVIADESITMESVVAKIFFNFIVKTSVYFMFIILLIDE